MSDLSKLKVTSSPHMRSDEAVNQIMLDVIIALMPALAVSIYVFGARALSLACISVMSCMFFEFLYCKMMRKPNPIGDLSAVVTGILLAFVVPVTVPVWMLIIGAAFAIIVVKQLYGGIGKNFMNPALTARAFLMASWPALMTTWVGTRVSLPLFVSVSDVTTSATAISSINAGVAPAESLTDMALGMMSGCLGETSAVALLLGGIYLLYRKVITLHTPLAYIGTVAVITFAFPKGDISNLNFMLYNLLSGGLMLGAIFMATDYTTSPISKRGQVIFGIGCGLFTVFIRYFGAYPEGVSYAILVMNACVFLIEKISLPKKFGALPKEKKVKEATKQ